MPGNMQVGEMIAFITYTMQIVMSFLMLAMVAVMLPRAGVAADRIDEVMHAPPATIHDPDAATAKPALERKNWNGEVEFKDVSFRYPRCRQRRIGAHYLYRQARRDHGHHRLHRLRQIDAAQPDPALL